MKNTGAYSPLTAQVTATIIALAVFSLALVAGFGFYAISHSDSNALAREKLFMASGLVEQEDALASEQRSVVVWDDTVLRAKAGDQQWMRENIGEWLYSYYGHDRAYVLDHTDTPIHAMQDGKTVEPRGFAQDRDALAPIVQQLRARLAQGEDGEVRDIAMIGDLPALVNAMAIIPNSNRVSQGADNVYLHITVQLLDAAMVSKIAAHFNLTGAGYSKEEPDDGASLLLTDANGVKLGYLHWTTEKPGTTLAREMAPVLAFGLLLGGGAIGVLLRRLRRASAALQSSQDTAQFLAFHDTLTGLPNRALFDERLRRALLSIRGGDGRIALICLDLDRFKQVNDSLGHPAGDELVRQVALRLTGAMRPSDTVARLGGDEFAIILADIRNVRTAEDMCGRLLGDIAAPFDIQGEQVFITASIGIAVAPDTTDSADELLRKADIALYEAKRAGRGRYQVFVAGMDDMLLRRRTIEAELRLALDARADIGLTLQPVFAADGGAPLGAEAQLRWNHPTHGALPPHQVASIAAERGLIVPLTEHMVMRACSQLAQSATGFVALPISPHYLSDRNAAERLLSILEREGIPPQRLQLELAETAFTEAADGVRAVVSTLRGHGVLVAVDDFGTGRASLATLRKHPVDKLKIDRSFVQMLDRDPATLAFVRSLIALAASLGMRAAADGVETEEQRELLKAMGCHEMQGPLLSTAYPHFEAGWPADRRAELAVGVA